MNELIDDIHRALWTSPPGVYYLMLLTTFIWQMERLAHSQRKRAFVSIFLQQYWSQHIHVDLLQHRQSQELDVEVASMIEMAETASATGDSVKQSNQDDAASSPSETSLTTTSTENLIPDTSSVLLV